jgi:hypothetical protein
MVIVINTILLFFQLARGGKGNAIAEIKPGKKNPGISSRV